MPTRVFSALDAATDAFAVTGLYRDGDGNTELPLSDLLTQTGVGSWSMDINLSSANDLPTRATAECLIFSIDPTVLVQEWTIDYTNFPAIPENARIKKLVFNRPRSVNYTYTGAASDMIRAAFQITSDAGLTTPIYFTQLFDEPWTSPTIKNQTVNGASADEVIFDYTGNDDFITRAELIASYSQFNNNFSGIFIQANVDDVTNPANCALAGSLTFGLGWTVTVTYEEAYEYTLEPENTRTVQPGTEITVTSDPENPNALDTEEIETITVQPLDSSGDPIGDPIDVTEYTVVSENELVLILPDFFVEGIEPTSIELIITSNQFTGPLTLQTYLTILITNAPGIYKLVPGQHYDILYDRADEEAVTTIQTKIPNPFIKTGYING